MGRARLRSRRHLSAALLLAGGMTNRQLAEAAGVPLAVVSMLRCGRRQGVTPVHARRLAAALDEPPERLFEIVDESEGDVA